MSDLFFNFGNDIARLLSDPPEFAKALNEGVVASLDSVTSDDVAEGSNNLFLQPSDQTKLNGIEDGATADQTAAEILAAWESESGIDDADVIQRDGSIPFTGPVIVPSYTVVGVPTASSWAQGIIYVSDETGGAVLAFSDGTNWRRVTDRAVIS